MIDLLRRLKQANLSITMLWNRVTIMIDLLRRLKRQTSHGAAARINQVTIMIDLLRRLKPSHIDQATTVSLPSHNYD